MPRLVLSLPAELGPSVNARRDRSVHQEQATERQSAGGPESDAETAEQPSIEQWLDCWAG